MRKPVSSKRSDLAGPQVVIVDPPTDDDFSHIVEALKRPEIMVVQWSGYWSEASLESAGQLARNKRYADKEDLTPLSLVPELTDEPDANAVVFREESRRLLNIFKKIGIDLGVHGVARDVSRVEPVEGDTLTRLVSNRHVDGEALGLVSPIIGQSTAYLDRAIPGKFDGIYFHPADEDQAKENTRVLASPAIAIFKCIDYPFADQGDRGWIHWRGPPEENTADPKGRVLTLMKLKRLPAPA